MSQGGFFIVVLNDGETWSSLEGAEIRFVESKSHDLGNEASSFNTLFSLALDNPGDIFEFHEHLLETEATKKYLSK